MHSLFKDNIILSQPFQNVHGKNKNHGGISPVVLFEKSDQIQCQSQNDPNQSDPLGGLGCQFVQVAGLILAHVSVGLAGNGSAQAVFLAGLHQNHCDQSDAGDHFQSDQNISQDFHFYTPLRRQQMLCIADFL